MLLHFLQEFSQQTISRTHEIKKQVDGLISETKATDCRLHNVFNDFLMLSNTQFIENRVYDEEVEEPVPKADVGDKSEQDLYIDRPLPYLIGSQQFMEQDDVGLGDLSSEEGSVDSDRGSVIDSEEKDEEESDDEFGNPSEDDQKTLCHSSWLLCFLDEDDDIFKPPKLTDEDFTPFGSRGGLFSGGMGLFDDEESDLFAEAPKEESREERVPVSEGGSDVFGSTVIVEKDKKPGAQSTEKTPKQPGKVVLFDDDDDDFFAETTKKPPDSVKSTADLFDDDEEEGDLFKEKPAIPPVVAGTTKETERRRETVMEKKSQPSSGDNFKPLSETPPIKQRGLFSDEEDSEDLFSSSKTVKSKATSLPASKSMTKAPLSLFDDDEEDHWNVPKPAKLPFEDDRREDPVKPASAVSQAKAVKKTSLFEEEDEEDLFAITKER
ncbi:wash complex subunit hypothetical protein [Limosa lapponica baueri]|uniref:FAM21/CAPZIP domain-containing protein n=1 Tax=Limosa lapponica baueri TaxID=1758121 RepID=A0A2I0TTM8_LIMLA|nr:wash complex subunit hypothetical protein [Limosa lapponica baueri]